MLFSEPYTIREARIHVRHIRDLLKSVDPADAYAGVDCNSVSFLNIVTAGDILGKAENIVLDKTGSEITTAADDKFCDIFPNFGEKNKVYFMRIICQQTILMKYALFIIFFKSSKI